MSLFRVGSHISRTVSRQARQSTKAKQCTALHTIRTYASVSAEANVENDRAGDIATGNVLPSTSAADAVVEEGSENSSSGNPAQTSKTQQSVVRRYKPRTNVSRGSDKLGKDKRSDQVYIKFSSKQYFYIDALWLRDSCTCAACVDPHSKQKKFLTSDIPGSIRGQVMGGNDDSVTIKWTNDIPSFGTDHLTHVSLNQLRYPWQIVPFNRKKFRVARIPWQKQDLIKAGIDLNYSEYMQDDKVLHQALLNLRQFGLVFLTGVPESAESVEKIAERIGPIKHTLYGRTWDVKSVPEALNVAYTSQDLGFHMDLLPLDTVPALQLLHCIRSSAKGGKSLFSDGLRVVNAMRENKAQLDILSKLPVTYHYDHPETHIYKKLRPVIEMPKETYSDKYEYYQEDEMQINWSPPFQGPFELPRKCHEKEELRAAFSADLAKWADAANRFNDVLHKPEGIYDRQMAPGECVIFANRRVLHARTAFEVDDAGKERWLVGAYIDESPWTSKYKVLERKFRSS